MVTKRILFPDRLRRIPRQFSWVDHRLIRDKHTCGLGAESLALYLFLVTVGDAEGLSYYSDASIEQYLGLHPVVIAQARAELCSVGLIAYSHPLYQVLSLEKSPHPIPVAPYENPRPRGKGELVSLGHILRNALGGVQ
jgi:hypothetical protein